MQCLKKAQEKLGEPLVKVEHRNPDMDQALAGVVELSHDALETSFAFAVSKFTFDWDAVESALTFQYFLGA